MRSNRKPTVIASRRSRLAQAQARAMGEAICRVDPTTTIQYLWITSEGDQLTESSLADAGGKGLFARSVEQALTNREADLAVHSLKDLPAIPETPGLVIAAVPPRADVRDCLISPCATNLDELPPGATLGTASPRRASQAKRLRPDLQIQLIRGNVDSRLRKVLTEHRYDATLLAVAGLRRADLAEHAQHPIEPSVMLPAAGQGALAIQCRADDHQTLSRCLPLNDALSAACVHAERQIVAALGGNCHSPIAVLVRGHNDNDAVMFQLEARVLSPDGQTCLQAVCRGPAKQLHCLTQQITDQLQEAGCQDLLNPQ